MAVMRPWPTEILDHALEDAWRGACARANASFLARDPVVHRMLAVIGLRQLQQAAADGVQL